VTWIKIDDQFADHPKFVARSDHAIATWVRALAYSSRYLTDGVIPKAAQRLIGSDSAIDELVAAGVLIDRGDDWEIHDYTDHQRTRAEVEADRAAAAERSRAYRNRKRQEAPSRERHGVTDPARHGARHATVTDPESETETDHHPRADTRLSTGSDEELINQALTLLTERRCQGKTMSNPDAYRAKVRATLHADLYATAADLLTRYQPPADVLAAALEGEQHSLARYRITTGGPTP
jgi:hypothetical protein